ncbi:hypothetical protein F4777DRAFT_576745 [Nemania sp. FL0916]|nr:hypothetical protein F4777DRAFT_576745 [Nemania sp. FL0916]
MQGLIYRRREKRSLPDKGLSTAELPDIPIHNHSLVPPPVSAELCAPQPSSVLRKVGRDEREWNMHVAMQEYRTKKRVEASSSRRDGRTATVMGAVSGQLDDDRHVWACRPIAPVSLQPGSQPVSEPRAKRRETCGAAVEERRSRPGPGSQALAIPAAGR